MPNSETPTRRWLLFALAILAFAAAAAIIIVPFVWRGVAARVTAAHQRSVAQSLVEWGEEYTSIDNPEEANRAAAMAEYIKSYYVVAEGYRSDPETEAALEAQRVRTLASIAAALRDYELKSVGR